MRVKVELIDLPRAFRGLHKLQAEPRSQAVDIVHEDLAVGACREDGGLGGVTGGYLDVLDRQLLRGEAGSAALIRKMRRDGSAHIDAFLDVQPVYSDGFEYMSPRQHGNAAIVGPVEAGHGGGRGVDGILRGDRTVGLKIGEAGTGVVGDVGVGTAKKPLDDLALVIHGGSSIGGAVRPVVVVEMASWFGCAHFDQF